MVQIIQIVGAVAILAAFGLLQARRLVSDAYVYLLLNLIGGVLLFIAALAEEQWGFLMLETAWSLLAAWGLTRKVRGAPSAATSV
jgi:hypothetical protein